MAASIRAVLCVEFVQSAAAIAGATVNTDLTATRPFAIYETTVLPLAASAGSTAQISRQALGAGAFNTVTNAMAAAVAGTLARTTTVTVAERTVSVTDVLRMVTVDGGPGGANAVGYVRILPNAIAGN